MIDLGPVLAVESAEGGEAIPWLGTAMTAMLHTLLFGAMLFFLGAVVVLTLRTTNPIEKAIRALAMFTGALLVIGAEASGNSYADFIIRSLGEARPLTFGAFGVILPGAAGVALAWYLIRSVNRSENVAVRFLGLFGMLATTQFAVMYGAAVSDRGYDIGATAVPNIAFVSGLFLWVVFNYDANKSNLRSSGTGFLASLLDRQATRQPTRTSLFEEEK